MKDKSHFVNRMYVTYCQLIFSQDICAQQSITDEVYSMFKLQASIKIQWDVKSDAYKLFQRSYGIFKNCILLISDKEEPNCNR